MAELTDAQRKRQDARKKRRGQSDDSKQEDGSEPQREETQGGESLEAVKQAAKVAAAGAAVGAAAAAARALTHHGEETAEKDEPEEKDEPKRQPQDQDKDGRAEDEQPPEAGQEPRPENQADDEARSEDEPEPQRHEEEREPVAGASLGDAGKAMRTARDQLQELLGKAVESASGLERTRDGWIATLEVVEVSRIPETTDVLGSYELELDDDLGLRSYRQVRRYTRSEAGRDGQ